MKTTTWLSTGAFWIGLKTIRSTSTPPANDIAMVRKNAAQ